MNDEVTFLVLNNIKHNGQAYEKGSTFEGTMSEFGQLIDSGALKVFTGEEEVEEEKEEEVAEVNTWGAQPDQVVEDEKKDTAPEDAVAPETVVKTREEMVAELGEDKVAEIEKNAEVVDAPKDALVIDAENL